MKIERISVYRKALSYVGGVYRWGRGNAIDVASSTVVVIDTDTGLSGCGEFCPCGDNYMEAHSEGTEAAMRIIGPALLGADPRQVERIYAQMDHLIKGHAYAKAALDAACWDLLGKATGQPVWMLLGGKGIDGAPMYRVAPQQEPDAMAREMQALRDQGYRIFQIKVGADWREDIERIRATVPLLLPGEKALADANQGWLVDEALRVAQATNDLDYILEQPCQTYAECLQVRQHTQLPIKLDECITGLDAAQQVVRDRAAEVVCLKISNLGGLTRARVVRDFFTANRIPAVCEDTWGGEITTATLAHFAASSAPEFMLCTTDLHNYNVESTGKPGPRTADGRLFAPDAPGLGVEPDFDSLGDPVAVYA